MHRIKQSIELGAPSQAVYETLTQAALFSELSGGAPADLTPEPGAEFSLFGGMISGRNLECEVGSRLVQAWRAKPWAQGQYSVVTFTLSGKGNQCRLTVEHGGFPEGQGEHLSEGWQQNYLGPLEKRFGSK